MKLHSPAFEKKLRRGVKAAIRSSPELRKQFRALKLRKHYNSQLVLRPAFSIAVGIGIWRIAEMTQHAASGLAGIAVWAFIFIFVHAQSLWNHLYRSRDSNTLMVLPVSWSNMFQWESQKYFRACLRSFFDILAGYGAVAWFLHLAPITWPLVFAAAVLTWAVSVALGIIAIAWAPILPFQLIIGAFFVAGVALFITKQIVGLAIVVALFDRVAPVLNALLPTGWPGLFVQLLTPQRQWLATGLLLPLAAILWASKKGLDQERKNYYYMETPSPEAPDLVPGADPDQEPFFDAESPVRVGQTMIEEIIQERTFFQSARWHDQGPLEKLLWRWLTPREKRISEFLFPHGVILSKRWVSSFKKLAVLLLAGFLAGLFSPVAKLSIIGVALFFALCLVLWHINENGRAFEKVSWSGLNVPLYAGYPTGLGEISRFLLKYSTAQFPAVLLTASIAGVLVAHLLRWPLFDGLSQGLRGGCLLIGSKFIFLIFNFSAGTNDSTRFRWRAVLLLIVMVVFGGTFLLSGGFGVALTRHTLGWLLTLAAVLDAYLFFLIYRWFYRSGRFDLMNVPRG